MPAAPSGSSSDNVGRGAAWVPAPGAGPRSHSSISGAGVVLNQHPAHPRCDAATIAAAANLSQPSVPNTKRTTLVGPPESARGGSRTHDRRIRNPMLYPAELPARPTQSYVPKSAGVSHQTLAQNARLVVGIRPLPGFHQAKPAIDVEIKQLAIRLCHRQGQFMRLVLSGSGFHLF